MAHFNISAMWLTLGLCSFAFHLAVPKAESRTFTNKVLILLSQTAVIVAAGFFFAR
jgi:nitric oxide reductase large subunit